MQIAMAQPKTQNALRLFAIRMSVYVLMQAASTVAFFPRYSCQTPKTVFPRNTEVFAEWTQSNVENEPSIDPRKLGLALALDDGTRKSHSMAENTAFVSGFFKGLSTRKSYSSLITSLYYVYDAMETAFDGTTDENVKRMDNSELRRLDALRNDLQFFHGLSSGSSSSSNHSETNNGMIPLPSPATKTYVSRIEEIANEKPHLLIAHQYTRYLGDLFGGQMMKGMAVRSLDLPANEENGTGVAFYNFPEIDSVTNFITEWYTKLNNLDLSAEEKQEIVDEANFVFALNIAILEELEGSPLKALWTLTMNSFKQKLGIV